MDEFYNQVSDSVSEKPRKSGLILGLITAFILFGVSYVLGIIFFLTPIGMTFGFMLTYIVPLILFPFVGFLIPTLTFLIINSIVLAFSKKGSGFRRGIKFGFLFLLIYVAVILLLYINMLVSWNKLDIQQVTQKKVENGDVSICDKMVVKEGWEDKENCYAIVADWAIKTGDASNCDRINQNLPLLNSCILQIAQKNHDQSVCNKLATQALKENCYFISR